MAHLSRYCRLKAEQRGIKNFIKVNHFRLNAGYITFDKSEMKIMNIPFLKMSYALMCQHPYRKKLGCESFVYVKGKKILD